MEKGCVTPEEELFLEAKSIVKHFGGVVALHNGCLGIRKGKIGGLLGANGSGKTTLSKIVTGIYQPTAGELIKDGDCIEISSPTEALKYGIVMVHQHLSLIPELTVWENICLGHEQKGRIGFLQNRETMEIARKALDRFDVSVPMDEKVTRLSPAKKQIVEIAKAISQKPQLLLLDEPTAALEKEEVESLFTVMRDLKAEGVSMIFTSHRMWEVLEICDYVTVFRNGGFVGEKDFDKHGKNEREIVDLITGLEEEVAEDEAAAEEKRKSTQTDETVLKLDSLILQEYRERDNRGVSLDLKKGEIVGISGLQGQGQEELLLILSGFMEPASGTIFIEDQEIHLRSPREAINRGIVLVPGDRNEAGLFNQHDITFNLNFPLLTSRLKKVVVPRNNMFERAREIIKKLTIHPPDERNVVQNLSGGNQQKIVIGKWLPLNPSVFLLSDPAKGVDVQAKKELYGTVQKAVDEGASVIVYASDNKELISVCDRIFVMFEGAFVEEVTGDDMNDETLTAHSLRARFIAPNENSEQVESHEG